MGKKRILCFGDSLTWGFDPERRLRFGDDRRWTGVLQNLLGDEYTIIEEGQNGRTIASDDPAEGEKNGLKYIIPCIESQTPVKLLIVMLGGNDLKRKFSYSSMDIAGEMQIFLEKVISHNHFRMNDSMKILLISPPIMGTKCPDSWLADCFDFDNAKKVCGELADWYKQLSKMYNTYFLDAAKVVEVSDADGVHIDAEGHKKLAEAIRDVIKNEIEL